MNVPPACSGVVCWGWPHGESWPHLGTVTKPGHRARLISPPTVGSWLVTHQSSSSLCVAAPQAPAAMATAISTLRFYEWSGSDCLPWPGVLASSKPVSYSLIWRKMEEFFVEERRGISHNNEPPVGSPTDHWTMVGTSL